MYTQSSMRLNAKPRTVESQCTPRRSGILTGRQSVRSGTYKVSYVAKTGLVPWEYTITELLSDAGYATSLWGQWHCGEVEGRLPIDQSFDEGWGYKNSVDEAGWTSYAAVDALAKVVGVEPPQVWEGKKGGQCTEPNRAMRRAVPATWLTTGVSRLRCV